MGTHIPRESRRTKVKEHDELARRRRTSFKQYLQDLEEQLLDEEEAAQDDPLEEPRDD